MRNRALLLWLPLSAAAVLLAPAASGVTIDWVYVGDPGNPSDAANCTSSPCGSVSYGFFISKYEITNTQYAEFLNAKASSDPLALYSANMSSDVNNGGVTRSGAPGAFTYAVKAGFENKPVTYVSFFDALRFSNWMNNGYGSGDTESGAYTLLGGTAFPTNGTFVGRNTGATTFLTSENEWYKAAYFIDSDFWGPYAPYATQSFFNPTCSAPTSAPNTANCWPQVGRVTDVGSYPGSPSHYGTFDQAGNVREWTDVVLLGQRQARGGEWGSTNGALRSGYYFFPNGEDSETGFRVASMIPEPGTAVLLMTGLLGLAYRQRRHGRAANGTRA